MDLDKPARVYDHEYCGQHDDGGRSIYTLTDRHGESQEVVVCMKHAEQMPLIDDDRVFARPCEYFIRCDFHQRSINARGGK